MLKDDRNETEKAEALEKRETKLEVESSDDDLDCRSKRDNQKGRGVSVKLQLGPSKAEVERTTKNGSKKVKLHLPPHSQARSPGLHPPGIPHPLLKGARKHSLIKGEKKHPLIKGMCALTITMSWRRVGKSTLPM